MDLQKRKHNLKQEMVHIENEHMLDALERDLKGEK